MKMWWLKCCQLRVISCFIILGRQLMESIITRLIFFCHVKARFAPLRSSHRGLKSILLSICSNRNFLPAF